MNNFEGHKQHDNIILTCDDIYHHMYLEFLKRPAIIVEHKTQYLSHNLHFFRGGCGY